LCLLVLAAYARMRDSPNEKAHHSMVAVGWEGRREAYLAACWAEPVAFRNLSQRRVGARKVVHLRDGQQCE
jgi:hypothetical protein